jgi:mannose-6-phosphate isomerase-like protein (cupin superfamily)
METAMNKAKPPKTDSIQTLAEFWDTHDLTNFEDDLEEVTEPVFVRASAIKVHLASPEAEAVQQVAQAKRVGPHAVSRTGVPAMDKVSLRDKFAHFADYWSPKVVGDLNGQQVKLVKFVGEFMWHHHENEDELFLVVKGQFRMEFRDRHIWLEEGEMLIVPRGVEHRPVADKEAHVLLFEPATTLNTGNVRNERTLTALERI